MNEKMLSIALPKGLPYTLEVFDNIDSTNSYLKAHASDLPSWHVVIADTQSAGRGRMGRSFLSPPGTGLYLSVLMRPKLSVKEILKITTVAAVAACRAIEACTDAQPAIKWVNDIYVRGKKVCGILTEASLDPLSGEAAWVVMGIGFNVFEPDGGFPPELAQIAGAIIQDRTLAQVNTIVPDRTTVSDHTFASIHPDHLRSRLASAFLSKFYQLASNLTDTAYVREYRDRSSLLGKRLEVRSADRIRSATALEIDDACRLQVRYDDGTCEWLSAGEVSVRSMEA